MNCKKCGKEIDYDAEVCNECADSVAEVASAENVVAVNASSKGKMAGFGKALTSLLLPIIGAILIGIASGILVVVAKDVYETLMNYLENPDLIINKQTQEFTPVFKAFLENDVKDMAIFLLLLIGAGIVAFIMSIVGIILGAQSIGCFKKESKNGNKPIPTLILGILGLMESVGMIMGILSVVGSVALLILTALQAAL